MNATNDRGHIWNGEKVLDGETIWWVYTDDNGRLYESKETPVYRIDMRPATQTMVNGKLTICFPDNHWNAVRS